MSLFKKKKTDIITASLVDAEHVSASHKLEVNELFYFRGKKVSVRMIDTLKGEKIQVLVIEE